MYPPIWVMVWIRGWFNTSPCCNALTTTQHVSGTTINVHTTCNSMHKMWIFYILKPYFHHKNARRIQIQLDRRVPTTVKLRPIKSKVNSPLIITKFHFVFQFQNSVFPKVFNGCCGLLQRLKFKNTNSLRDAWRTGLETSSYFVYHEVSVTRNGNWDVGIEYRMFLNG